MPEFKKKFRFFEEFVFDDGLIGLGLLILSITDQYIYFYLSQGDDEDFAEFVRHGTAEMYLIQDVDTRKIIGEEVTSYMLTIKAFRDLRKEEIISHEIPMPLEDGEKRAQVICSTIKELVKLFYQDDKNLAMVESMQGLRERIQKHHGVVPEELVETSRPHQFNLHIGRFRHTGSIAWGKFFLWVRGDYYDNTYTPGGCMDEEDLRHLDQDIFPFDHPFFALAFRNLRALQSFLEEPEIKDSRLAKNVPYQLRFMNPRFPIVALFRVDPSFSEDPVYCAPAHGVESFKGLLTALVPYDYERYIHEAKIPKSRVKDDFLCRGVAQVLADL